MGSRNNIHKSSTRLSRRSSKSLHQAGTSRRLQHHRSSHARPACITRGYRSTPGPRITISVDSAIFGNVATAPSGKFAFIQSQQGLSSTATATESEMHLRQQQDLDLTCIVSRVNAGRGEMASQYSYSVYLHTVLYFVGGTGTVRELSYYFLVALDLELEQNKEANPNTSTHSTNTYFKVQYIGSSYLYR